jgi:hypothetical protein
LSHSSSKRVLDLDEAISLEKLESSAVIRRTSAVADHLLGQGTKSDLPSPDRARALAMAIPIFLSQRTPRLDEARLALDLLEELAHSNKVARSPSGTLKTWIGGWRIGTSVS